MQRLALVLLSVSVLICKTKSEVSDLNAWNQSCKSRCKSRAHLAKVRKSCKLCNHQCLNASNPPKSCMYLCRNQCNLSFTEGVKLEDCFDYCDNYTGQVVEPHECRLTNNQFCHERFYGVINFVLKERVLGRIGADCSEYLSEVCVVWRQRRYFD